MDEYAESVKDLPEEEIRPQTWRETIQQELDRHGETWDDVKSSTLSEADLDRPGDNYAVGAFTLWTATRVYFPAAARGWIWATSVARDPDGEATEPIGEI